MQSVLNMAHDADSAEAATQRQKDILLPRFADHLRGDEARVLDLGCGPGRFTPDLASIVDGHAVGVDPIPHLLDLAPEAPGVSYQTMQAGAIPLDDNSVDAVWICLVLGGIVDDDMLQRTAREVERVLRPGGLLFLVENTSDAPDAQHWVFRSADAYDRLFSHVPLQAQTTYQDAGETITVMTGTRSTN